MGNSSPYAGNLNVSYFYPRYQMLDKGDEVFNMENFSEEDILEDLDERHIDYKEKIVQFIKDESFLENGANKIKDICFITKRCDVIYHIVNNSIREDISDDRVLAICLNGEDKNFL